MNENESETINVGNNTLPLFFYAGVVLAFIIGLSIVMLLLLICIE